MTGGELKASIHSAEWNMCLPDRYGGTTDGRREAEAGREDKVQLISIPIKICGREGGVG